MNLFCNVLITPLVQLGSGFQGFGFRVRLKVLSSETERPRRHVDFTIWSLGVYRVKSLCIEDKRLLDVSVQFAQGRNSWQDAGGCGSDLGTLPRAHDCKFETKRPQRRNPPVKTYSLTTLYEALHTAG